MKALTVAQPWASLIAHGAKTIETRPSPPNGPMRPDGVRGLPGAALERGERIAIHAAVSAPTPALFPPHGRMTSDLVIGRWADPVRHLDDCECLDPEEGSWSDACWALNDFDPAVLRDEGAHGWSLAFYMPLGAVVCTAVVSDALPIIDWSLGWTGPGDTPRAAIRAWDSATIRLIDEAVPIDQVLDDQAPLGDFSPGRWGWLLTDIRRCDPVPCKGRQGVWRLPDDIAAGLYPGEDKKR